MTGRTSIKNFIDVGDPGAPIGSPAWCKASHLQLCATKRQTDLNVRHLKFHLVDFKEKERWRQLTNDKDRPFRSWEDYVQYPEPNGLGMAAESVKAVLDEINDKALIGDVLARAAKAKAVDAEDRENQRPVGRPPKAETVSNVENVAHNKRPSSGSAARALRKLREDRPDIHARVLAGELTPHAGMVEAGFRKKRASRKLTVVERVQRLWSKATEAERTAIRRWIENHD